VLTSGVSPPPGPARCGRRAAPRGRNGITPDQSTSLDVRPHKHKQIELIWAVDFPLLVRQRLKALGVDQRELAAAAQVTESYISQLLTGKKPPPAPERTDVYDRMEILLKLPAGQLARLADLQRKDVLKRKLADPPAPLFKEVRELILRKCAPDTQKSIRSLFEKEPFGALERLVTQKLLDVVKRVTRAELDDEGWLRLVARMTGRSYEELRVIALEFLETDVFNVSAENCVTFLDPLLESWNIDLATFGIEIVLNRRLVSAQPKRIEFVEREPASSASGEPGLQDFLEDPSLSGDATPEEIEFLRALRFTQKRPTALYYYRELQNLRDPLHFRRGSAEEERS
jgi:transcriptional regulator with XRE-family HTH domain